MQHIFIINPKAGKSDDTKHISKIVHQLFMDKEVEGTYRIERTTSQKDTFNIARKYAQSGEKVTLYAVGGDGTLNDVLNGCMGYDNVILSHLPTGTGNDFIKLFGKHAKEDFLDLKQLMNGHVVNVDVLDINGNYSINIANIGLDAMIAFNANKFKRVPFVKGKGAYQMSLAYSFFTSTSHYMKIIIDGIEQKEDCYTFVVCANAKYYGGSYCAAPFANIQDGLMDVILIPKVARHKILQLMKVYEKGEHLDGTHNDIIRYHKAKKVEILAKEPIQVCLEGENHPYLNPVIQVSDKKMKLLVPPKYTQLDTLIEPKEESK